MKTDVDVSIIIVNYNTLEITKNCIDSIFEHTSEVDFEVIVVDNDSCDGSKEILSADNRIVYIQSGGNLGFGRANNLGYAKATGKYLFLLNSDTLLLNNAVKLFYDIAENDSSEVGCWGTMLIDKDGNQVVSYGKFLSIWYDLYLNWIKLPLSILIHKPVSVNLYNYPVSKQGFVDYITGADIFMRKSVAYKYGLFDANFFLYFEETDMERRYAVHGIKRRICTEPKIIHLEGGSQEKGKVNLNMQLIRFQSKMLFFRKWNNSFSFHFYIIALSLVRIPFLVFHRYPLSYKKNYLKILWNIK